MTHQQQHDSIEQRVRSKITEIINVFIARVVVVINRPVIMDDLDQLLDEFEDEFHPSKETTISNRYVYSFKLCS